MNSLIAETAAGRALLAAAQQRAVGAPVYLRYAFEAPSSDTIVEHAAEAAAFAAEALGEARSVYASAVRDAAGRLVHVAVAVHHVDGCVALLGIGVADQQRRPPTLLFLGDQGAIEGNPAVAGAVLYDDSGGRSAGARPGAVVPLRDDGAQGLAAWLAEQPLNARYPAVAAAIRRSLASGRAEAMGQEVTP
jgi:hypothetical protein